LHEFAARKPAHSTKSTQDGEEGAAVDGRGHVGDAVGDDVGESVGLLVGDSVGLTVGAIVQNCGQVSGQSELFW
jgi:hypothetical protein